jgi:hypothetical protein
MSGDWRKNLKLRKNGVQKRVEIGLPNEKRKAVMEHKIEKLFISAFERAGC